MLALVLFAAGAQQDYAQAAAEAPELLGAELLGALGVVGLETAFLGRVFLVGLLEERNYVLAEDRNASKSGPANPNFFSAEKAGRQFTK